MSNVCVTVCVCVSACVCERVKSSELKATLQLVNNYKYNNNIHQAFAGHSLNRNT